MDERVLREAQQGSSYALSLLLQEAWPVVYRYILKLTCDPHRAQDITQETMLRAVMYFRRYDEARARLTTWLCHIARNIMTDQWRKLRREVPEADFPLTEDTRDAFDELLTRNSLLESLRKIPEIYRAAVVLHYMDGLTYAEVGKLMDVPEGTAKSRVHLGIQKLRKEMAEDG